MHAGFQHRWPGLGGVRTVALGVEINVHTVVQDKAGSSAAGVAAYGGHVDCVARVLDSTAIASDRGMSALHLAVQVFRLS